MIITTTTPKKTRPSLSTTITTNKTEEDHTQEDTKEIEGWKSVIKELSVSVDI